MMILPPQEFQRRDPGNWSRTQQVLAALATFGVSLLLGWLLYLEPAMTRLQNREREERALKDAYRVKIQKTAALHVQQQQLLHAHTQLRALQQQLATSDERHQILEQLAASAKRHALKFELSTPARTEMSTQYMTHATGIRLSGRYHDLGRFAAAISAMPKVVVLSELRLSAAANGVVMEVLVLTYQRHPDQLKRPAGAATP